jgi:predicted alpha/beta hydrolase
MVKMIKRNKAAVLIIILLFLHFVIGTIVMFVIDSGIFVRIEEFPESIFGKVESPEKDFFPYYSWKEIDQIRYSREEVYFNSSKNKLQGFVYGRENANGLVVISQGFGATADVYLPMIMYFVDKGWRVFAFNNTGVGGSEGKNTRGLIQSVIDLDAALSYVESSGKFTGLPVMLAGHSWGGYAVCAVLNYNHRVRAVVSFAGFSKGMEMINERGVSMIGNFAYIFTPQQWIIEKMLFGGATNFTAVGGISKSLIPVMLVQCSNDNAVRPNSTSIYAHRKEITNPYVEIIYREGEDAIGHDTFYSKAQKEYIDWAVKSWEAYKAENKSATTLQWANEISFNKKLANELDPGLFERINTMFNNAK